MKFFFVFREQYLFDVFEAIISTLESKLQRIENLDKAVEHLMRRVEGLDDRVNSNIDKTESVISKLRMLDSKIFNNGLPFESKKTDPSESAQVNIKLIALDQKVSDIDDKLNILKNQLDTNSLQGEDINAEASEKRSVSMNVVEITKALNTEVINHVTKELGQLRETTGGIDRKLQFHITLVQENLGKVLDMVKDVHHAIIDDPKAYGNLYNRSVTTTTRKPDTSRSSKIDSLVQQIQPIITVSEKMDEVWNVVVGTKSSVDDLVPKSDELLTQTQRQERAIGEIHNDLRMKTNKIIANLDKVEKRLKKQEDDVATLAQRPVPAEILLEPNLEDVDEYESTRYIEDYATDSTLPPGYTTQPPPITQTSVQNTVSQVTGPSGSTTTEKRLEKRKGGIIFPSVKNKPTHVNTTFVTSDVTSHQKDVKVSEKSVNVLPPPVNYSRHFYHFFTTNYYVQSKLYIV